MASSWIITLEATERKPVRYQAVYRDGAGKQRSAGVFPRKADAKKALATVVVDTERGAWVDPAMSRTTVKDYASKWLAAKQVAPSTLGRLEGALRREIVPYFGDKQLKAITPSDARTWVVGLSERLQPLTIRVLVQTFRSMLNDAVEDGYLAKNPVRLKAGDLPRVSPSTKMFLTVEQIDRLIENVHPHYRAMVHITAWTGMRFGEVTALEWDCVDYTEGVIRIERAVAAGGRGELHYGPPKSEASRREISLDPDTKKVLRAHRMSIGGQGLVFRTKEGRKAISQSFWRTRVWNPACVATFGEGATGLERACPTCEVLAGQPCVGTGGKVSAGPHKARHEAQMPTFHDLRHSHISHLLASGVDPVTVSKRAGHASTVMTLNTYGRLRPDHAQVVNDAIAKIRDAQ